VPVVQTTVHEVPLTDPTADPTAAPLANDSVQVYEHVIVGASGSGYDSWGHPGGSPTPHGPYTVVDVGTPADPVLSQYTWLAFEPEDYVNGATGNRLFEPSTAEAYPGEYDLFDPAVRRWKVLNAAAGVLSGELPCYPGNTFRIGGPAAGGTGAVFAGELDEVRISVLPTASPTNLAGVGDWAQPDANFAVRAWVWMPDVTFGVLAQNAAGMRLDLADETGTRKLFDGGYFLLEGDLYDFDTFAGNIVGGVEQLNADLTTTGTSGPAQTHEQLRRLIPLNYITSTRLAGAIAAGDTTITLADVSQLPDSGYLKVDDEIIAYNGRDTVLNEVSITAPLYRRGYYGTSPAGHAAAASVRLLPVRWPDRYRVDDPTLAVGPWDGHTGYTVADLDSGMCMFSWQPTSTGKVSTVEWRLKDPLPSGHALIVLVNADATPWNANPSDAPLPDYLTANGNKYWGTIFDTPGAQAGRLDLYWVNASNEPDRASVQGSLEVRFYWDLSRTSLYNHALVGGVVTAAADPVSPVELDTVRVELLPQPGTF